MKKKRNKTQDIKNKFKSYLKNPYPFILIIVIIFLSYFTLDKITYNSMISDEALYAWKAQKIYENPSYLLTNEAWEGHPPLISSFVAILDIFLPFKLIIIAFPKFLFIFSLIIIYLLGKKIKNEFVGLLSAIFLAIKLSNDYFINRLYLDVSLIIFFMLTLYYFFDIKKKPFLFGLFLVAFLLTKRVSIVILPFLVILFLFKRYNLNKKKFGRSILFLVLIFSITIFIIHFYWKSVELNYSTFYLSFLLEHIRLICFLSLFFILVFINIKNMVKYKETYFVLVSWVVIIAPLLILFYPYEEYDLRHLLLIFPGIILFISLTLNDVISYFEKINLKKILKNIVIFLVFFLFLAFLINSSNQSNCFPHWNNLYQDVSKDIPRNSSIYMNTQSYRLLRFYSNKAYNYTHTGYSYSKKYEDYKPSYLIIRQRWLSTYRTDLFWFLNNNRSLSETGIYLKSLNFTLFKTYKQNFSKECVPNNRTIKVREDFLKEFNGSYIDYYDDYIEKTEIIILRRDK
ncbi:glycosyltransferase family 39 protein [Candidatus Woesearchaeota archaeon]|nr:glycosyltransferase family 39 protein [Candidatus Woesearchaeota archaeon]